MKLIALMPVRNEARILATTLTCLEKFCDHIIISDHRSTDKTRDIARGFSKVTLIDNPTPHDGPEYFTSFEAMRPALFDAARQFDGNNLLLCIDADEIPPPSLFINLKSSILEKYKPGDQFCLWWVQLWRSFTQYRDDESVWSHSYKPLLVYDDRTPLEWTERQLHTGRLPILKDPSRMIKLDGFPVLHLQWAYWDRTQFKQARYRILEFIQSDFANAESINAKYSITLGDDKEGLTPVPAAWLKGVDLSLELMTIQPCWQYDDILVQFNKYGIARFEPLQIWHIPQLNELFVARCGRAPKARELNPQSKTARLHLRHLLKTLLPPVAVRLLRKLVRR